MKIVSGIIILIMLVSTSFATDCGDVNNSGDINVLDITYLIAYIYQGGSAPNCEWECDDVNNDGAVNINDVTYLIAFLYKDGPTLKCGPEMGTVSDIDGNVYKTVKIGEQWWMAENLKVTHFRNGEEIPFADDTLEWRDNLTPLYCNYNFDTNYVSAYGRMYNNYAVEDSLGIAPDGWHVPTDEEWKQLEMYLGMSRAEADETSWRGTDEGEKLKEIGTIHWSSPNLATNETGFSALPWGFCSSYGYFYDINDRGMFTLSRGNAILPIMYRRMNFNGTGIVRSYGSNRSNGLSVRCVKD